MKRINIMMLLVSMVFILSACSSQKKLEENQTESETQPIPTIEESTSPSAELGAPGDTMEFKMISGVILSVADDFSQVTVQSQKKELKFSLRDTDIETEGMLEADKEVTVIYKGEISGNDTSNAAAVMVLDKNDNLNIQTVSGNIVDQGMSIFTIETGEGESIGLLKNNCEGMELDVFSEAETGGNGNNIEIIVTYIVLSYGESEEDIREINIPLKIQLANL